MKETNSNATKCFISFCFFIFLCPFCRYETQEGINNIKLLKEIGVTKIQQVKEKSLKDLTLTQFSSKTLNRLRVHMVHNTILENYHLYMS
jgi:hypothetical protein